MTDGTGPAGLIDAHLNWLAGAGRRPATITKRGRLLRHMHQALPYGLGHADEEEIAAYLAPHARVPWTYYTYYQHAAGFFAWCVRRKLLTADPMADLPRPGQGPKIPHPCTDRELITALTAPEPYRSATLLAAYMGLRAGEIARAHTGDLIGDRLRVIGKGGRERMVPLHEHVAPLATGGHLIGRDVTEETLINGQRAAWDALGLPKGFRLHSCRHWYATMLLRTGADIREVQTLLGHASIATTEIYLAVVGRRLTAAVARLPRMGEIEPDGTRLDRPQAA